MEQEFMNRSSSPSEPTVYHDNAVDRLFIALFSRKMSKALGERSQLNGYDGFVDLSKKIMQGRSAQEQQAIVAVVLQSLVPAPVLYLIRTLFNPTPLICELNAWFATVMFEWLVGPCRLDSVDISDRNGSTHRQKSSVHIEKCRYLEQSRCVGMCINMCKLPTQKFFTEGFGIPLTMTPNFEDFSCDMVFGQIPPPLETEDAYRQPCLAQQCPTASSVESMPCPKVRT